MLRTMVMGGVGGNQAQLQASLDELQDGEGSYYSNTTANQATGTHTCAPFLFSHAYTAKSPSLSQLVLSLKICVNVVFLFLIKLYKKDKKFNLVQENV